MTTIAWGRNMLAADSRASTERETRDNSTKIHRYTDPVYIQKELVLAVGTAGNIMLSRGALKVLQSNPDSLEAFYKQCIQAQMHPEKKGFALLIVTDKSVFTFIYSAKLIKLTKHKLTQYVAIGSGAPIARYLMSNFDVSATDAVLAAMTTDKATGGSVNRYTIDGVVVKKLKPKHYTTARDANRRVAVKVAEILAPVKKSAKS